MAGDNIHPNSGAYSMLCTGYLNIIKLTWFCRTVRRLLLLDFSRVSFLYFPPLVSIYVISLLVPPLIALPLVVQFCFFLFIPFSLFLLPFFLLRLLLHTATTAVSFCKEIDLSSKWRRRSPVAITISIRFGNHSCRCEIVNRKKSWIISF